VVDFCELGAVHLPVQPMNAPLVPEPFDWPGWAYEEKYDGVEEYQPNLREIGDHRIAYGPGKLVLGTCS